MTDPAPWYPVLLDLGGRRCLVVGGGTVGARKAEGLLSAGAEVTMVTIEVCAAAAELLGRTGFGIVQREYRSSDLDDVWFVVTAMDDPAATAQVHRDAQIARVWMNAADDPPNCSVILPAVHRDADVIVAVSTGGSSPAVAGWLRDRIARDLGGTPGPLVTAVKEVRLRVRMHRSSEGLPWRSLVDELAVGGVDPKKAGDAWLAVNCLPSACPGCTDRCRALDGP